MVKQIKLKEITYSDDIKNRIDSYPVYYCEKCTCFFDELNAPSECQDNNNDDCELNVHYYKELRKDS